MVTHKDWVPSVRADVISMSRDWLNIISTPPIPFQIPPQDITDLMELTEKAEALLIQSTSSEKTEVITAQCKEAFHLLVEKMRFIKAHYFLSPPLTDADFVSLKLKPKEHAHTPIPPPVAQAEADFSRPGQHQLMLHLRAVSNSLPDPHRSDHGFRIYWGIMPAGGASVEFATGGKRELVKPPVSGEELPHSKFTRKKNELLDFAQEDSGKTVYFCIRFENAKGEPGPWGPMLSTIIP
jgi:hypothetical protein